MFSSTHSFAAYVARYRSFFLNLYQYWTNGWVRVEKNSYIVPRSFAENIQTFLHPGSVK